MRFRSFPTAPPRRQNEWIDEASCFLIIIQTQTRKAKSIYHTHIKKTRRKNRTHHTPTQEYVVPKSIPIAGPSDLEDMFVVV